MISLCMIVRNEGKCIECYLASMKPLKESGPR